MKVIITTEKGNVQSVFTDVDCDIVVLDYDEHLFPKKSLTSIPDAFDKRKKAYVYKGDVQITAPKRVKEILKLIKKNHDTTRNQKGSK